MSQLEDFISIKSNENIENIAAISEAYLIENYNIKNSVHCEIKGKTYSVVIKKETFELISKCIAQNLLIKYALLFIKNLFEEDYGDLSNEENYDILAFLQGKTKSLEFLYFVDLFDEKLHFFTNKYNRINIEGFFTFGINDIKQNLCELLEKYANEFLIEEELAEFSYMLKSYIDTEPSGIDEINIIIDKSGGYKYFDKYKNDITQICLAEFYAEFYESDASEDEILISVLILNLPQKITIHKLCEGKNTNLLMMLKNIFGNRLRFCLEECAFCKS